MATDVSRLITDYATLQAVMADTLNRVDLNAQIPTFIQLAEDQLRKKNEIMRRAYRRAVAQLDGATIAVPDDYGTLDYIKNTDAPSDTDARLEFVTSDILEYKRVSTFGQGRPRYYTISGAVFEFVPVPASTVNLQIGYWRTVPSLSDANPTNWLLEDSPGIYLYTSLLHSAPYLKHDERIQTWGTLASGLLEDIRIDTDRSQYSGAPLRQRTRRSF